MSNYYMGVDASGFKGDPFCFCVMKKTGEGVSDCIVVALYKGRDEKHFNKEMDRVKELYNIPENNILKQD